MKRKLKTCAMIALITMTLFSSNTEAALTSRSGVCHNERGYKETYYNLNMSGVVRRMRERGYSEEEYPYWVREDGCKMLGDYIIVAADLSKHPRGATLYTSLGAGIVCDTGSSIKGKKLDIATNW